MRYWQLLLASTLLACPALAGRQAQTAVTAAGGNTSGAGGTVSYNLNQPKSKQTIKAMNPRRQKPRLMLTMALTGLLISAALQAQSPEKMSYQAVIRNTNGALLANQNIGIRVQILQSSESGAAVYTETHSRSTNANGLVTLEIGGGSVVTGSFSGINWDNGPYFLKTEIDPGGGTSYSIIGTTQLMSVPYALQAKSVTTETDLVFTVSPAAGITGTNITNWNTAFGWGNHSGLYRPVAWVPSWTEVTAKPTEFPPAIHPHSAADITSGTVAVARGGTGISSFTTGNYIRSSGTSALEQRTPAQVLSDIGAAATAHTHGNITSDGKIGTTAGRIITTGIGGTLQATAGTATGQMLYWNESAWVNVPPGSSGQVLTLVNGVPTWTGTSSGDPDITEVINPTTGKTWMDRNLGAIQVANSYDDANSYGHLYQWGRNTDGHQEKGSVTTTTLSNNDIPGHGNFILASSNPVDWRSPQNDNLWQGVNGTNNPCPSGYRLPTATEWDTERLSWSSTRPYRAFESSLKLTFAGNRGGSNGSFNYIGDIGYYWSSTISGTNSDYLHSLVSGVSMKSAGRAYAFSVRCIKD